MRTFKCELRWGIILVRDSTAVHTGLILTFEPLEPKDGLAL